jgi:glycosyltransferase involved in cell wall biosynthesis
VKKKHILFIVENNPAPPDARVWAEARAAKEFGYDVSIISPYDNLVKDNRPIIDDIGIYRHPRPAERSGRWGLVLEYINAAFWEFLLSVKIFFVHRFHVIHGANPPDHIFLISLPFKLLGVKFVFDHHDLTPENYAVKFAKRGLVFRLLLLMERLTFRTADLVISTNESYAKIAQQRGGKKKDGIIVVRNGPDLSRNRHVALNPNLKEGFNYLIGYVGVIGQQEGIENLLAVVDYLVHERKRTDIKFIVVGRGPHLENVRSQSEAMGISQYICFTGYIPREQLYEVLATSDLCVNPEFGNEFTDKSTMIKIMEYMAFGKPVVQFYTSEGEITAAGAAAYVKDNDIVNFAEAIMELLADPVRRQKMGAIGRNRIEKTLSWAQQKKNLEVAYKRVLTS